MSKVSGVLFSVFQRRNSCFISENPAEIVWILISHFRSNVPYAVIGLCQQSACFTDPLGDDILIWGDTGVIFERHAEGRTAFVFHPGKGGNIKVFFIMSVDMFNGQKGHLTAFFGMGISGRQK